MQWIVNSKVRVLMCVYTVSTFCQACLWVGLTRNKDITIYTWGIRTLEIWWRWTKDFLQWKNLPSEIEFIQFVALFCQDFVLPAFAPSSPLALPLPPRKIEQDKGKYTSKSRVGTYILFPFTLLAKISNRFHLSHLWVLACIALLVGMHVSSFLA